MAHELQGDEVKIPWINVKVFTKHGDFWEYLFRAQTESIRLKHEAQFDRHKRKAEERERLFPPRRQGFGLVFSNRTS